VNSKAEHHTFLVHYGSATAVESLSVGHHTSLYPARRWISDAQDFFNINAGSSHVSVALKNASLPKHLIFGLSNSIWIAKKKARIDYIDPGISLFILELWAKSLPRRFTDLSGRSSDFRIILLTAPSRL
jgi:hypothetical protein